MSSTTTRGTSPDIELARSVAESAQEIVSQMESTMRLREFLNVGQVSNPFPSSSSFPPRNATYSSNVSIAREWLTKLQEEDEELNPTPLRNINVPATHFSSADKELLDSGKYSDAKVVANGKTYNVHKSVLCTRSKWFRKGFESAFREGQTSTIEISAPDNIDRLLEFLYTGAVDLSYEADILGAANELSVLGDFYLSDELKSYAAQVLGQYLGEHLIAISDIDKVMNLPLEYYFDNNGTSTSSAWRTGATSFRIMQCAGFVDRLCNAIRDAYATPSGIQQVYVDFVCAARIRTFECSEIQALKDEIPEFGLDMITAMMTGLRPSVFEGNKAFKKWRDPLFRTVHEMPADEASLTSLWSRLRRA